MLVPDLDLLVRAAEHAGDIACRYTGPTAKRWDKPDGAGPVTEADLAVNAYLEEHLQQARPDYGWLSEETEDTSDRLDRDQVFIIDPIDGTRSFAEGSRTWAHSFAIASKGIVTQAVIYLPQRDLMFTASAGGGAFCNGSALQVSSHHDWTTASVLAPKPNLEPQHWRAAQSPSFQRHFRPSLAYRMATVASGRFDAMMTLRASWEWDIAAGDLLIREAGGYCSDRTGQALRFNSPQAKLNGVLAANQPLHQSLWQALAPVDQAQS